MLISGLGYERMVCCESVGPLRSLISCVGSRPRDLPHNTRTSARLLKCPPAPLFSAFVFHSPKMYAFPSEAPHTGVSAGRALATVRMAYARQPRVCPLCACLSALLPSSILPLLPRCRVSRRHCLIPKLRASRGMIRTCHAWRPWAIGPPPERGPCTVARAFATGSRRGGSSRGVALTSPLHDLHLRRGAKFTLFNGWRLPAQYGATGAVREHEQVRRGAGLFDVSHLTPVRVDGPGRADFIERVTVADARGLPPMTACPTFMPTAGGGVLDTGLLVNAGAHLFLTTHAGYHAQDVAHMRAHLADFPGVSIAPLTGCALMDLQGPAAAAVLHSVCDCDGDVRALPPLGARAVRIAAAECHVTRYGYTGEDGFQIMCVTARGAPLPAPAAAGVARALLFHPEVVPAGLGARDSLRLEAGLPLFGQDIAHDVTAAEAGILHLVAPRRRAEGGFVGEEHVLPQTADPFGGRHRRVGFVTSGPPARRGDLVFDHEDYHVGVITSGGYSPSLRHPICMGYVAQEYAGPGTGLLVGVRGKKHPLLVRDLPFVAAKTHRG